MLILPKHPVLHIKLRKETSLSADKHTWPFMLVIMCKSNGDEQGYAFGQLGSFAV